MMQVIQIEIYYSQMLKNIEPYDISYENLVRSNNLKEIIHT
jgi:hypothetical protein